MTAGELPARPSGSAKPQSGAARRDYWDAAPGPLAGSAVQRRLASDLAISLQQSPMALLQPSMRTISQPAAQRIGPLASQEPYDTGTKVRQISDMSASTPASAATRMHQSHGGTWSYGDKKAPLDGGAGTHPLGKRNAGKDVAPTELRRGRYLRAELVGRSESRFPVRRSE